MGKSEFWTIETTRKWLSVIFQVKKKINLVSLNSSDNDKTLTKVSKVNTKRKIDVRGL